MNIEWITKAKEIILGLRPKTDVEVWEVLKTKPSLVRQIYSDTKDFTDREILINLKKFDSSVDVPFTPEEKIKYEEEIKYKEYIPVVKKIERELTYGLAPVPLHLEQTKDRFIMKDLTISDELKKTYWKSRPVGTQIGDRISLITKNILAGASFNATKLFDTGPVKEYNTINSSMYPVSNTVGSLIGFSIGLALTQGLSVATTVKWAPKLFSFMKLSPKINIWLTKSLISGFAWGSKGMADEMFDQLTNGKLDFQKTAKEGLKEFGYGGVLAGVPFEGKFIRRVISGGIGGSWAVMSELIDKGYVTKDDFPNILVRAGISALFAGKPFAYDKEMIKAYKKAGIEKELTNQIILTLKKNKPGQQNIIQIGKILVDVGKKKGWETGVDMLIIQKFPEQYKNMNVTMRKQFSKLFWDDFKKRLKESNNVTRAWDEVNDYMQVIMTERKSALQQIGVYKVITKGIIGALKEKPALALRSDAVIEAIKSNPQVEAMMKKFPALTNDIVNNLSKIIKSQYIEGKAVSENTIRKVIEQNSKENIKIIIKELVKLPKVFAHKTTKKEYIEAFVSPEGQKRIQETINGMIDNLPKLSEAHKTTLKNTVQKQYDNFLARYKTYQEKIKAGGEPKRLSVMSPLKFIEKIKEKITAGKMTKAEEAFGFEYKQTLKDIDKSLQALKLSGVKRQALARMIRPEIKGKGVLAAELKEKTMAEMMMVLEPEQRNNIMRIGEMLKKFGPQKAKWLFKIPSKTTPVEHFTPADYMMWKFGIAPISQEANIGMIKSSKDIEIKIALVENLYKGFYKAVNLGNLDKREAGIWLWNMTNTGKAGGALVGKKIPSQFIEIVKTIRAETEELYKKINFTRSLVGLPPIKHIQDYMMHVVKPELLEYMNDTGAIPNSLAKLLRGLYTRKMFLRTAQERKGVPDEFLIKDVFKLMKTMYAVDFKYIHVQTALHNIEPFRWVVENDKKWSETVATYVKDFLNFAVKQRPSEWDKRMDNMLSIFLAPSIRQLGIKVRPRPWLQLVETVTIMRHIGALGYRIKTGIRNLFQLQKTWTLDGNKSFLWAIKNFNSKEGNAIINQVPEYGARYPIEAVERGFLNKVIKGAYIPMAVTDKINVRMAILSSYRRGLDIFKGDKAKALIKAAEDFRTSQWSYLRVNLPKTFWTSSGRFVWGLNSWWMNNYFRHIPEVIRRTFRGVDFMGNKLLKTDRMCGFRFLICAGIAVASKIVGINFLWGTLKDQMIPNPGTAPTWQALTSFGNMITSASSGDKKQFMQNWWYFMSAAGVHVPFFLAGKDVWRVIVEGYPIESLFLYGKFKPPKDIKQKFNDIKTYLPEITSEYNRIKEEGKRLNIREKELKKMKVLVGAERIKDKIMELEQAKKNYKKIKDEFVMKVRELPSLEYIKEIEKEREEFFPAEKEKILREQIEKTQSQMKKMYRRLKKKRYYKNLYASKLRREALKGTKPKKIK